MPRHGSHRSRQEVLARFAAAFLGLSCAGSTKMLGTPVTRPVALTFRGTPEVAAQADRRAMQDMAAELVEGMKEKGIASYIAADGSTAAPPRIDCLITRFDAKGGKRLSGTTAAMIVGPLLAPIGAAVAAVHASDVELECTVLREGERGAGHRRSFAGENGPAVANAILRAAFTDETEPLPTSREGCAPGNQLPCNSRWSNAPP